jgi:hypothetical protein
VDEEPDPPEEGLDTGEEEGGTGADEGGADEETELGGELWMLGGEEESEGFPDSRGESGGRSMKKVSRTVSLNPPRCTLITP